MDKDTKPKKKWYLRWYMIVIYFILVLGFLSNLTSKDNNQQQNTQYQNPKAENIAKQPEEKYNIGDTVIAGDFKWKVTKAEKVDKIGQEIAGQFLGKTANGEFLILSVEIENIGKSAKLLSDNYLKLVDEQGREFSADSGAAIYLGQGNYLIFEQINPSIVKKGKIVFDVPKGLKVAKLRISSNFAESSFYNVNILI